MAMVVVDDSCLQADSQPKSGGLVWGSTAAWRCSTFIRWTEWTLAMTLWSWWQHYKYRPGYYYYYYYYDWRALRGTYDSVNTRMTLSRAHTSRLLRGLLPSALHVLQRERSVRSNIYRRSLAFYFTRGGWNLKSTAKSKFAPSKSIPERPSRSTFNLSARAR